MAGPRSARIAQPNDLLYRKVQPGQWDEEGVLPAAFEDRHEDLSLFVARVKSPADVLRHFARFPAVRRECRTGRHPPTPAQMYEAGYRIASIRLSVFLADQFQVRLREDGSHFDAEGHLEIIQGQRRAATWASRAHLLSREETLG
jgi:hypothetical protein